MNNPCYYNLTDKKTASVSKLKKTFTAEIREFCNEMNEFTERNPHMNNDLTNNLAIHTIQDTSARAHELANFAYYHLHIYTSSEWNYINAKIAQAVDNAIEEVYKND